MGVTNHIKLAIADATDFRWDSNVFIKAQSFTAVSDITLAPQSATNAINTQHTLTATVTENKVPSPNRQVMFAVIDGPNSGLQSDTPIATDANGQAKFTYTSSKVGVDTIRASFVDSTGKTQLSNTVTKEWVQQLNTYTLTATATTGGSITAIVANGVSAADVTQTLTFTAGTQVRVTATPDPGYRLVNWAIGGIDVGSGNPLVLTMNNNYNVVATFASTALRYHPLAKPIRLVDTRPGAAACDPRKGPLPGGYNHPLEPVMITKDASVQNLLGFYMGKNTPERQDFIIANLKVEKDLVEDKPEKLTAAIARKLAENEVEVEA